MAQVTLLKEAAIANIAQATALSEYIRPSLLLKRVTAPQPWEPTGGTIYVAAADATVLPTGDDGTGDGSSGAPYLTLTKALSEAPSGGNYDIRADGTFAENNSGRFILGGDFTLPVVIRPVAEASVVITNASGTNGVVNVRNARAHNIQFHDVTITPSVDGSAPFRYNPIDAASRGSSILFYQCVMDQTTGSSVFRVIDSDVAVAMVDVWFVGCSFRSIAGASTANNPSIIRVINAGGTIHSGIGFWDCFTTDAQWDAFSFALTGVDGFTAARNRFTTSSNHALLVGTDTSTDNPPDCTNVLVYDNDLIAMGSNPHGLELGENVSGIAAKNRITSGLQGIVSKVADGTVFVHNSVRVVGNGGNGAALYNKGSSGCAFIGNSAVVEDSSGSVVGIREEDSDGVKAENTTALDNFIEVKGVTSSAVLWAAATGSNGGATSDRNDYQLSSGAALGSVRGTTVATLAEMQSAWVTAGLPGDDANNDANSEVI